MGVDKNGSGHGPSPDEKMTPDFIAMVADILDVDDKDVRENSELSFVELGGDSVKAIQLTFQLEASNITFMTEDIMDMENSVQSLSDRLQSLQEEEATEGDNDQTSDLKSSGPFSMLQDAGLDVDAAQKYACKQIQCSIHQIEDLLPMTAQQRGLWLGSLKQANSYIARWTYKLHDTIDVSKLEAAWLTVLQATPVLRSRVVLIPDRSPWQAVMRMKPSQSHKDSSREENPSMNSIEVVADYGHPLVHLDLGIQVKNCITLSVHHCLYDRWSMYSILNDVRKVYAGNTLTARPSYLPFLKPLNANEYDSLRDGWRELIDTSDVSSTSSSSKQSESPLATKTLQSSVGVPSHMKYTPAVLVTAAWALVCSKHRSPVDSAFGLTLWGRDIQDPKTLEMAFPTFSTLPFPTVVKAEDTAQQLLHDVNQRLSRVRALQRLDVSEIAKIHHAARSICKFSSVLVVQPELKVPEGEGPLLPQDLQSFELNLPTQLLIECTTSKQELSIRMHYDPRVILDGAANPILSQLCNAIKILCSQPDLSIEQIDLLGKADTQQIQEWLRPADDLLDDTLHALVLSQASKTPKSTAIWQTGVNVSYEDVAKKARQVASLILAHKTQQSKSSRTSNVGIFFPKSYLAVIAMIGILMSGNTYVPLDPSNPEARLDKIIEDADIALVLSSPDLADRLEDSDCETISVSEHTLRAVGEDQESCPGDVTSDDDAYIIYTSGSTGVAKGVVISHGAICSSVRALARGFKIDNSTRTFQFSSFAWDASCHDIWITLAQGGVICLPTDEERMEPGDFLRDSGVNYGMLTTTVASAMPSHTMKYFSRVVFTGEPVTSAVLHKWVGSGRHVMGAYGPTETTIVVLLTTFPTADTSARNLGHSCGAATWIVDQSDPNRLAPIGCVGELVTSGPTLAKGYWRDEIKTDAAFLTGLKWFKDAPGPPIDRVYLSGDLVHYNPDGSLQYVGRKGGYTKIAGNRVDLGEIEQALHSEGEPFRDVSLQVCKLSFDTQSRDILICFIKSQHASKTGKCEFVDQENETRVQIAKVVQSLKHQLPPYMIPSLFVSVNQIPTMSSGKIDARMLNEMVQATGHAELQEKYGLVGDEDSQDENADFTSEQKMLSEVWSTCLGLPLSMLKPSSHFFRIGGDSVVAMRVSAHLSEQGISLRVNDIFTYPVMSEMANQVRQKDITETADTPPAPFTLVDLDGDTSLENLLKITAGEINVPESSIEDIFPCSPLQTQMLVASERSPGSYFHRDIFQIATDIDDDTVRKLCQALVDENPMLRSRAFVWKGTGEFLQAIVKDGDIVSWPSNSARSNGQNSEEPQPLGLNTALSRFSIRQNKEGRQLIWDMHHAIYDGNSHSLLLEQFSRHILPKDQSGNSSSLDTPSAPPYQSFIGYLKAANKDKATQFWKKYLKEAEYVAPRVFSQQEQSRSNQEMSDEMQIEWKTSEHTAATYLRAAYALTLATYSGSSDVLFSETLNGRDAALPGIEGMVGPTFATIPARVRIDRRESIGDLLSKIQKDAAMRSMHQTLPIDDIRRLGHEYKEATQLDTHFLVQSASAKPLYERLSKAGYTRTNKATGIELAIPLSVAVTAVVEGNVQIEAIFNDSFVTSPQVKLMLDHFKATLAALLASDETDLVGDLSPLGADNIHAIMKVQPEESHLQQSSHTIPDLIFSDLEARSAHEALYSSAASYTYGQMHQITLLLASRIKTKVKAPHQMIATCLDKTPLGIMAQLAIMISGHAYVPINPSHPSTRHRHILEQTDCPLILFSPRHAKLFDDLDQHKLSVNADEDFDEQQEQAVSDEGPKPTDVAYVMYTSGSTGEPKGVVVEHRSICTTTRGYAERLKFTRDTRAMLFAAFTFDASVMETWAILISGGCLCIPSDEERISSIDRFIIDSRTDGACLTPTGALLLDPAEHKALKTLLLCGEECKQSDIERWSENETVLINAYGPTEASVCTTLNTTLRSSLSSRDIGTSISARVWIIDPVNDKCHLPIGSIGELCLSGDALARGYLAAPEKTAEKFIRPKWPEWTDLGDHRVYRTGDLAWIDINGRLHFAGRKDDQLKVNGVRIEASEIEIAVTGSGLGVQDAVATTYCADDTGSKSLALFFVPKGPEDDVADKKTQTPTSVLAMTRETHDLLPQMDDILKKTVPAAGIPEIYVPINHIPSTASGKLDKKHLVSLVENLHPTQTAILRPNPSEPSPSSSSTSVSSPPTSTSSPTSTSTPSPLTPTEKTLTTLWSTLLHVPASTIHKSSHFIRTGGDSVTAIRLSALARSHGLNLPAGAIYANPVLSDMAGSCDESAAQTKLEDAVKTPERFEMLEGLAFSPVSGGGAGAEEGRDYFGRV